MGILDFIFYVILVIAGTICFMSWVAFRYGAIEREREQARKKVKKEYKKVKEVK